MITPAPAAPVSRLPSPAAPGRSGAGRPAAPCPAGPASRTRWRRWRRAVVLATVALVVLASVFSAHADPSPSPGPAPTATASTAPTSRPSGTTSPCAGSDCIPQPSTSASPAPTAGTLPPAQVSGDGTGGVAGWIAKGITSAITGFFKSVIKFALNPLLNLISDSLLTTPSPASLPRVGELWTNSWQIAVACYGLLIAIAGIVVMSHESVQSRYSIKDIAPRIPLGFLAAALSLFFAGKAVDLANALSHAALDGGVNEDAAGPALRDFVLSSFTAYEGNLFGVLMWGVVVGVLVALLLTFVVRVALTMMLIVAAPPALVCHALPQTDAIARWWWKAFGGVLAVQVAQSLALITGVRVFLTPGGFGPTGLFGVSTNNGLVNVLITLALMYIVFKIPFWILGSLRFSGGRSFVGSVVRAYVMYKTFGLLRGGGSTAAAARGGARRPPPSTGSGGAARPPRPPGSGSPAGSSGRQSTGGNPAPARPGRPPRPPQRPPGPPLFQPPAPPAPAANQPTGPAAGPPPMPQFRAPGAPVPGTAPAPATRPSLRPARPPGPPVFQAPGGTTPSARPTGRPPVPTRPRFQQPTPQHPTAPRRATGPSVPAAFRPPVPHPRVTPMRRTSAPPPANFSSPPPAPPARSAPSPPPHPTGDAHHGGDPS